MTRMLTLILLVTVTLVSGGPAHHHDHHVHVHDNHDHVHDDDDDSEHVYDDDEDYEDGEETELDYETVYDAIRDELPELLTQVERRYKTHIQHHQEAGVSPLLSLFSQEPHSMTIMMNPSKMEPKIKVGLDIND